MLPTGYVPVSKWRDDQTRCISEIFVGILELSVADVCEAVFGFVVPSVSQLTEPLEGLGIIYLHSYHLGHHISGVDVDGTDGHDLLSISLAQVTHQEADQGVQL